MERGDSVFLILEHVFATGRLFGAYGVFRRRIDAERVVIALMVSESDPEFRFWDSGGLAYALFSTPDGTHMYTVKEEKVR